MCDVAARGTEQVPVSRDTGERAVKLFGHSALGWGAHIREFLQRREGAAMRLVCTQLHETVDGRWTFPWVRGGRWGDGDGDVVWDGHCRRRSLLHDCEVASGETVSTVNGRKRIAA